MGECIVCTGFAEITPHGKNFEVSTDYLLKDEMGKEEVEKISDYRTEDTVYRNVSMEEANHFLEWKRKMQSYWQGQLLFAS